ncbi:MAG: N-acetylneuraminate synthase [Candidatus Omnitrophica bacterium]|nr:N-acetylneuraminate synthase [Candidatus Omnitrophota bacterium]MDD5546018.1 N-acetylneuraminate synthase [Candidatus Omnitrophota bacterium]
MHKIFIIAEAGVNHNGSLKVAMRMVDAAADAGADAVKFQTFSAESLVSTYAPKAAYQKAATGNTGSQLEMIKKLELGPDAHKELLRRCRKKKVIFLSSPFDLKSVDFLAGLGLKIFKVPSGEINNLPYLRKIGRLKRKVILSTGMSDLKEVRFAMGILTGSGTRPEDITVLHCTTEYPAPMDEVNLRAMLTLKNRLRVQVGYSDHTQGIEVSIAAAALGAAVIEKHFTLDRDLPGPDHKASLEPDEFRAMVKAVRNIETALGDGVKRPAPSELNNRKIARKSIVAAADIAKGDRFTVHNITVKRPGNGLSPVIYEKLLGRPANKNFKKDELVTL